MKRTTKTLLCLLLALVMALQLGALAPAARADGVSDDATVTLKLFVTGGDYYSEEAGGAVTDSDDVDALVSVSSHGTIGALRGGLTISPIGNYAVTTLVVTPAMGEDLTDMLKYANATTSEDDGAAIFIDGDDFTDARLNGVADAYQLVIVLSPVTPVSGAAATCGANGTKPHYILNGEKFWDACCLDPVLNDIDLSIPATGEHTMQEHPAVAATCTTDGNSAYYECTTCGNLYSNEDGTGKLEAVPTIGAIDHDWSYSEPVWSDDNSECTMTRSCTREGCTSEPETETVATTSETTATCTAAGTVTYTAVFTEIPEFGTKTKTVDVEALGHEWGEVSYVWSEDNSKCKAIHSCTHDGCDQQDVVIEEVDTTSAVTTEATCKVAEVVTYYADFSVDGLVDQEKPVTGSTDPDKHSLEKHGAVAATCDSAGNEEYWACKDCGKIFKDAAGSEEIALPTIPKLDEHGPLTHHEAVEPTPEKDGNIEYWTCPCGKFFSDAEGKNEISESDTIRKYVKMTYDVLKADKTWKKGSTTGWKMEIDADFDTAKVSSVKIGGKALKDSEFKVTKGSVVVTIDSAALESLSEGKKTVEVTFEDGKTASAEVTIEKADEPTKLTLKIDEKGLSKVYDGAPFDLSALKSSITVEGLPSGYKAGVSIDFEDSKVTSFYNVGTTTVKLSLTSVKDADGKDVTSSFTCDDLKGVKLTITKRKISVETRSDSIVYNGVAWNYSTHCGKSFNPQPIITYTDPKLGEYTRDGKTYVQYISIRYTASPKNMGTYNNTAELIIREKVKGAANDPEHDTVVSSNYDITYKWGKIKITDSSGKVPAGTTPATGDSNNIWIWIGIMAAVVVIAVVLLIVTRKGRKGGKAPSPEANE